MERTGALHRPVAERRPIYVVMSDAGNGPTGDSRFATEAEAKAWIAGRRGEAVKAISFGFEILIKMCLKARINSRRLRRISMIPRSSVYSLWRP